MKSLSKESSHWNETEASMFIMQSIANKVPQRENSYVGDVVVLIINLPVNSHIALKHTALRLLAKVCPWINEDKDHIDTVFHFILNGLQDKQLATASAIAFEHFCEECCQSLTLHFQVILQVVDALDSLSLTPNAISGILKGAASVLSCLPYEQITEGLTKLCIPQVRHLTEILHNSKSQEYKAQKGCNDPVLPVDRLATIFRHTSPVVMAGKNHPCQTVVEELWPHLSGIAEKYKHSERIMERICRCLRFAIRCVGTGFGNLLQPFVEQMINIYYHYQHSCLLYLGSILVDEYGQDPNCAQGFIEMLKAYCGPTFTILSAQDGLQNRPDTVDDFFRLCIRLLQKCPVQFLENESMEAVMQLAVAAIALNHREANSSVVKFLVDLTGCARNDPSNADQNKKSALVNTLMNQHGSALVKGTIVAIAGGVQTYMVPDIAGVLFEIANSYRELVNVWLRDAISSLPSHSPTGAIYATTEQREAFYATLCSSNTIQVFWKASRDFCRLFQ